MKAMVFGGRGTTLAAADVPAPWPGEHQILDGDLPSPKLPRPAPDQEAAANVELGRRRAGADVETTSNVGALASSSISRNRVAF
jgi:hypothetical protein